MGKFKIGQTVVMNWFDDTSLRTPHFREEMRKLLGKKGVIEKIEYGVYKVCGWVWPESALTLVEPKVEDKKEKFSIDVHVDFLWTDDLIKEFMNNQIAWYSGIPSPDIIDLDIENFKKSKMNKNVSIPANAKEVKADEEVVYVLQQDWVTPEFIIKKGAESVYENGIYLFKYTNNKHHPNYHSFIFGDDTLKDESWFRIKEKPKPYVKDVVKGYGTTVGCFVVEWSNGATTFISPDRITEILIAENKGILEIVF